MHAPHTRQVSRSSCGKQYMHGSRSICLCWPLKAFPAWLSLLQYMFQNHVLAPGAG